MIELGSDMRVLETIYLEDGTLAVLVEGLSSFIVDLKQGKVLSKKAKSISGEIIGKTKNYFVAFDGKDKYTFISAKDLSVAYSTKNAQFSSFDDVVIG